MEEQEKDKGLIGNIKEYASIRKDLTILSLAEKASVAAGNAAAGGILAVLGVCVFLFGNLALGFYLSEVIGNSYAGFLILTAIYLVLALIVYFTQENFIKKPIVNGVIRKIFKEQNEGVYEKQN